MPAPIHYRWMCDLAGPPEALWPRIADTNRFDKDAGVPALTRLGATHKSDSPLCERVRLRIPGVAIEWLEEPFEWIEPRSFSIFRRYLRGPLLAMRARLTLEPRPDGGSRLTYEVFATPRNLLGRLFVPIAIGIISRRRFISVFERYDAELAATRPHHAGNEAPAPGATMLSSAPAPRFAAFREALLDRAQPAELVDRLLALIADGDEIELARLRPYALAREWRAPRRGVLELFLHATRAGLTDLRWDLLCPLCRGSKETSDSLGSLRVRGVHCDACHIDFDAGFEQSVELTFRPNAGVRPIEDRLYCIGGPRTTPHIVAQQVLAVGESRCVTLALAPGRYRVRTKTGLDPETDRAPRFITVHDHPGAYPGELTVRAGDAEAEADASSPLSITFANTDDRPRLFILERLAWSDDAATAADVFALQAFRDLFSAEALRPGEQISVGSVTLLFTDLKDSTRLYRDVGDAPAFGAVMSHFDVLKSAVAANSGALVKTMGDAIMAVFTDPADALRAAIRMHAELETGQHAARGAPLRLKSAIHTGPCIAVTLNERLDYFGSTVNIAARLVGFSKGGDIIVSDAARSAPEVARLTGASCESIDCTLKGFDDTTFRAWRLQGLERRGRGGEME